MRDGYYLLTYLYIDELSHLINVGSRHDQNISLFYKKGNKIELIRLWELERFTGIKMHRRAILNVAQAKDIINELLSTLSLSLSDIEEIWGTKELQTQDDYHSINDYKDLSYHNVSHLFSSIILDSNVFHNEKIIGLSVDGGPDGVLDPYESKKFYYTGCFKDKEKFELFSVHSPGLLWHLMKQKFKMREGSLMALGSASMSTLFLSDENIIDINSRKSFYRASEYIEMLCEKVEQLSVKDENIEFNGFDSRFSIEENKISMVVKEVQKMSRKIMERNIDEILSKYNVIPQDTYLALSGGFILNCPTNSFLMEKYKFKGMIAPPFVSDSGLSFGMGMYAFYKKLGSNLEFKFDNAFYGHLDNDLDTILDNPAYKKFIKSVNTLDLDQVVKDIIESPIVWFDGKAEVGPRALGNRSLLGDPRNIESKKKLNILKKREWWRPVAPIIMEEYVHEWFDNSYPSPYMLNTFMIKEERLDQIPSIAHLDNSARVQTINNQSHPTLHNILAKFRETTGIPIICNTSLNDAGEPIINSIEESLNFSLRKHINVVYVNGMRIELFNHQLYEVPGPLSRSIRFLNLDKESIEKRLQALNPYNVPLETIKRLKVSLEFNYCVQFNLLDEGEVEKLKKFVNKVDKRGKNPTF